MVGLTSLTIAYVGDPQVLVIGIHEGKQSSGSVHAEASFFEEQRVRVPVDDGLYGRLWRLCQTVEAAGKYFEHVACNCPVKGSGRLG